MSYGVRVRVPSSAPYGGLPERSNGTVSKTVDGLHCPWVQIPHPPPNTLEVLLSSSLQEIVMPTGLGLA